MKTKEIIYGAVGLGVLFLVYKAFKKRQEPNLELPKSENVPPVVNVPAPSNSYNKQEATTKALVTVKDWIKTYDGLSDDILNQKTQSQIQNENRFAELKAKSNISDSDNRELQILTQLLFISKIPLKDRILQLKNIEYEKVYSVLKDLYSQYSKPEVNKLMVILPNFLSGLMVGDDYKYSYDVFDKLSIEDKLFLNDIEFYKKFNEALRKKYPSRNLTNATVTATSI